MDYLQYLEPFLERDVTVELLKCVFFLPLLASEQRRRQTTADISFFVLDLILFQMLVFICNRPDFKITSLVLRKFAQNPDNTSWLRAAPKDSITLVSFVSLDSPGRDRNRRATWRLQLQQPQRRRSVRVQVWTGAASQKSRRSRRPPRWPEVRLFSSVAAEWYSVRSLFVVCWKRQHFLNTPVLF